MRSDYWDVTDEQVTGKTGRPLAHWKKVLDAFGAAGRKPSESVAHLQAEHGVPRYWARTLTTWHQRKGGDAAKGGGRRS